MKRNIIIYKNETILYAALAAMITKHARQLAETEAVFNFVLSGGSTPKGLYEKLALKEFAKLFPWDKTHVFWADERCVPPDDEQSNYKMANETLLSKVSIPKENVHRIKGENDPEKEADRYAFEIKQHFQLTGISIPSFDLILLGLGKDGHTASIFPGHEGLIKIPDICIVTENPSNSQKRITLTPGVINNARKIQFIVTGEGKAEVVEKVLNASKSAPKIPATLINPIHGRQEWGMDKKAASKWLKGEK